MEKESEIVKLTERIAKDPKSKLFVPLAEEYKKIGDVEMAISVLEEGLKNNPGYITARSSLGRLLMENGDLAGAQKELEEVIKAIPDNLLAQRKLGDLFILTGRNADALERYKAALALNPNDKEVKALVDDLGAGKDVSDRIPKPKARPAPAEPPKAAAPVQAPTQTPAVPSAPKKAPASGAKPAAVPLQAPPAAAPAASPVPQAKSAPPPKPAPVVSVPAPAPEEPAEAEAIEEIVEIEHLEHPAAPSILEEAPAMQEADSAEPSFDLSGGDAFDISAAPSEAGTTAVFAEEPGAWEAPAPMPAEAPQPQGESSDDINTNTLAELYVTQGFYEKAIEIYEGMLADRPDSTALQQRLEKIRAMAGVAERNAGFAAPEAAPVEDTSSTDIFARSTPASAPEPQAPQPQARPAPPPAPAAPVEPAQPPAASGPQARRKETIDRLESWLKNIMKEKP